MTLPARRVTQSILGPGDGYPRSGAIPGNCLQAAVASLLDLDRDAVPHFALFDSWRAALQRWAQPAWRVLILPTRSCGPWTLPDGGTYRCEDFPPALILVGGSNGRPGRHAVVGTPDDVVLWDPHPSRAGLSTVEYHVIFIEREI